MIKCHKALGQIIERKRRYFSPDEMETINVAHGKLVVLEEMEEQGRLVILPCKVGDALFVTNERTVLPAVRMVESVAWHNGRVIIRAVNSRTGIDYYCSAEDFGKTVFLTREEAEAALKGGQHDAQ